MIHRSSTVRKGPTIGFASDLPAWSFFGSSRRNAVAVRSVLSCQIAVARRATSTITPFPVFSRCEQRSGDAAREHRAARRVAERAPRHDERRVGRGEDVADAATRPEADRIEPAEIGVGAALALAVTLGVHEARVHLPHVLGHHVELLAGRRQEVREEDVGVEDQTVERGAALGDAEVEGDPSLVPVVELEQEVEVAGVGDEALLHHGAQRVARRALDLHDVGAPVGEDRAARRHEAVLGQLHHLDPVEHTHAIPSVFGEAPV